MTTRIILYCRVSTKGQAEQGVSLDAQEAKGRAYAALYDLELVAVLRDEGESAKTLQRPGLQRALAMLDAGLADGILVLKLDRLTRSVRDLGDLIERYFAKEQFSLLSVQEHVDTRTAAGRMVVNILMSVSAWEREVTVERTVAALEHKKARGERVGQIPYGHRLAADGRQLEPDAAEQARISYIRALRQNGLSIRAIVARLNAEGVPARPAPGRKTPGCWQLATVHRLLRVD